MKLALFIFAFLIMAAFSAEAAVPCTTPPLATGWGQQFLKTAVVAGFNYDQQNKIMWTMMIGGLVNWFFVVPLSTAQAFSNQQTLGTNNGGNPDTFYKKQVAPFYHEGFLDDKCNELITPQGTYLWIR